MSYERRFQLFLAALLAAGLAAAGVTLVVADEVASDALPVGPGSSRFPPQGASSEGPAGLGGSR
ncbi:MAG: hypothetical protein VKQ33_13360 [Candidatus Sericytochromatia bacterium]|nr:hypothetical protein [Candidatus Sericytochromatia bacterium]